MNCHCDYCASDSKNTPDLIDLIVKWLHSKWDVRDLLNYTWSLGKNDIEHADITITFRGQTWYLIRITLPDKLWIRLNSFSTRHPQWYDWSNHYNISNKEDWEYIESHVTRIMKCIGIGEMPQEHEQNTSI